jgi:hypothetical protein
MTRRDDTPTRVRWARLRFATIGPLLSIPTDKGELGARIADLAEQPRRRIRQVARPTAARSPGAALKVQPMSAD